MDFATGLVIAILGSVDISEGQTNKLATERYVDRAVCNVQSNVDKKASLPAVSNIVQSAIGSIVFPSESDPVYTQDKSSLATYPAVTDIVNQAVAAIPTNTPTLAMAAAAGGFAGTEEITGPRFMTATDDNGIYYLTTSELSLAKPDVTSYVYLNTTAPEVIFFMDGMLWVFERNTLRYDQAYWSFTRTNGNYTVASLADLAPYALKTDLPTTNRMTAWDNATNAVWEKCCLMFPYTANWNTRGTEPHGEKMFDVSGTLTEGISFSDQIDRGRFQYKFIAKITAPFVAEFVSAQTFPFYDGLGSDTPDAVGGVSVVIDATNLLFTATWIPPARTTPMYLAYPIAEGLYLVRNATAGTLIPLQVVRRKLP